MKKLILATILALPLIFSGCKSSNPNIGPALLQVGVSTGAGYGILKYPQAVPGVRAGADVICAAAAGTNVSPANIVAAIDAYGELTPEATFILQGALNAYSLVYNGMSDTNTTVVRPYAQAVCNGLNEALLLSGQRGPAVVVDPDNKWPQLKRR